MGKRRKRRGGRKKKKEIEIYMTKAFVYNVKKLQVGIELKRI
jgi:hypothetical protein